MYFEQPGEPWSIHVEIHVAGRLDPERLLSSARVACERHPMARVRLAPFSPRDHTYRWEVQDHVDPPDLEVVACVDEQAFASVRERLLETHPSLDAAPPFKLALIHRPQGDALILNLHHAACDGVSAVRIVTSIWRSYAGIKDPVPAFDPLQARDLRSLVVPPTRRERLRRMAKLRPMLAENGSPYVRVAPRGSGGSGNGLCLLSFDEQETTIIGNRRSETSTMNDVLLGGLALAIRRWNSGYGAAPGRISMMMPANIRAPSWSSEVLGNFVSSIPVSVPQAEPDCLEEIVSAVTKRTRKAKQDRSAHALIDVITTFLGRLPVRYKHKWESRIPKTRERMEYTAILSNLGRLTLPDLGGEAGSVQAAWFSPPARFTRGFAIGALSLGGRLQFALRYHRALFDDDAAADFTQLYRDTLLAEQDDSSPWPTNGSPSMARDRAYLRAESLT